MRKRQMHRDVTAFEDAYRMLEQLDGKLSHLADDLDPVLFVPATEEELDHCGPLLHRLCRAPSWPLARAPPCMFRIPAASFPARPT